MPYRHAHWFLLAIFPLAALAFWPGYLATIASAPLQMHAHGVTATLWLMLLVAQSWSIHSGRNPLHRMLGAASLVLFPLFLAGGSMIFLGMAERYFEGASPFYTLFAPRLALIDLVSVAAFAGFYYEALRLRRKTQLHARYMLATVLFLLPPILGRLMPILPPLAIHGPGDFWKLGIGFQLANAVTAAIAFGLAFASGRHGRPFFLAGGVTLLAALLFEFLGPLAAWKAFFVHFAAVPALPFAFAAGLIGAGIGYAGWIAGRRPAMPGALAA
ncbi:hypothetical protein P6144_15300 [Sphingomonas sp. HITSZ_GF]|uniref:hypothetical protein n=1 Tax=Sphingomonas sp. HITSZ_GF TaxID=3037247 RepID=UPI00240E52D7|nr:hypothetical protein [Sphingomonas sp. HITSZ_GF]MDG2535025.1 hypothetical protein [Sphingomonas sp. HITSZ_GF]